MNIPPHVNFNEYVSVVGELEAQEIHSAGRWEDDLVERSKGVQEYGDKLPWSKTWDGGIRFRPSEVTVWAGQNGHRKSMCLGMAALWWAKDDRKVAIASLEMQPTETLWRMCLQAAGSSTGGTPTEEFIREFSAFADKNILIYDQLDSVKTEKILGFVHYAAKHLGCNHIIIDSLAKAGISVEDRQGETEFINRLAWAAKHLKCHIHLVAHIRKPQSGMEHKPATKYEVKGSSTLVDLVDNVIVVHMDKKRDQLKHLPSLTEEQQNYFDSHHDMLLCIQKQRHGAFEGTFAFYNHPSLQMTAQEGKAIPFDFNDLIQTKNEEICPNIDLEQFDF
jgi:twinkle protein